MNIQRFFIKTEKYFLNIVIFKRPEGNYFRTIFVKIIVSFNIPIFDMFRFIFFNKNSKVFIFHNNYSIRRVLFRIKCDIGIVIIIIYFFLFRERHNIIIFVCSERCSLVSSLLSIPNQKYHYFGFHL